MGLLEDILGLLGRKKAGEEEEFAKEEVEMVSSEEKYAGEVAEAPPAARPAGGAELEVQLESLKAQIQALREMRGPIDERLAKLSEEIGELKQGMLEAEKRERELAEKAERAADLVASVQPEKLLEEVKRLEARIEEGRGALERLEAVQRATTDELKEVKGRLVAFRGLDTVVELSDEVRKELAGIKEVEATIEKHADKVEFVYVELQKKAKDIQALFERMDAAEGALKTLAKDAEKVKARVEGVVQREDLAELKKSSEEKLVEMARALAELKKFKEEIERIEGEEKKLFAELQRELEEMRGQRAALAKEVAGVAKSLGRLDAAGSQLKKRMEDNEKKIEEGAKLLLESVGKFADFEKELHEKFEELEEKIQKSMKEGEEMGRKLEAVQKDSARTARELAEAREALETLIVDLDARVKALEKAARKK
ncbi:MAG: hypothetical protein QXH27_01880 [Candidatus Micrarchaeia archaeon]